MVAVIVLDCADAPNKLARPKGSLPLQGGRWRMVKCYKLALDFWHFRFRKVSSRNINIIHR